MNQKKIVLFSHDGSGLGHLRRISRIAEKLQLAFATLIVTGMRNALWLIPEKCEFCYLPSWDALRKKRANYWGKDVWLDVNISDAIKLRSNMINSTIAAFEPDAILVDYLPYGLHNELELFLNTTTAKKYLILRGLIDTSDSEIFFNDKSDALASIYDRIFIAADKQIINLEKEYKVSNNFVDKLKYVGYVTQCNKDRANIRENRGIVNSKKKWIVCSAGGGKFAEDLIAHSIRLAELFPDYEFDIVAGPLSNFDVNNVKKVTNNCRIHKYLPNLSDFHSACDILINTGGYNSLLEGGLGGANIIVYPNQRGLDDEQINNANRLSKYFPIVILNNLELLANSILTTSNDNCKKRDFSLLEQSGSDLILETLIADLN